MQAPTAQAKHGPRTVAPLPWTLIAWAGLGILLNVGVARLTYGVMLPSLKRDLGLDYFGGGALNAIHLLGYLAGTLSGPALGRWLGMQRLSRTGHVLVVLGALACAAAPAPDALGPWVLAAGRLATGLGAGWGVLAIMVLALAAVAPERRSVASLMIWSSMGIAMIVSGLAAPWLLSTGPGWRVAFLCSALIAAAVAIAYPPRPFRALAAEAPEAGGTLPPLGLADLASARWGYLVSVYFTFGLGYIAYSTFAGARLAANNAPVAVVSATWVVFGITTIVGVALTGYMLARPRLRRLAMALAALTGAVGCGLSVGDSSAAALAGAMIVGLGIASTPAIMSAYARERAPAEHYARAFSFATAAMGIGQLAGPLIAGALADRYGTVAVPLFAAATYVAGTALAVLDGMKNTRRAQA